MSLADETKKHLPAVAHLNHCVDILFQHISCRYAGLQLRRHVAEANGLHSNNANLVTRHWTKGQEYPVPDL